MAIRYNDGTTFTACMDARVTVAVGPYAPHYEMKSATLGQAPPAARTLNVKCVDTGWSITIVAREVAPGEFEGRWEDDDNGDGGEVRLTMYGDPAGEVAFVGTYTEAGVPDGQWALVLVPGDDEDG